MLDFNQFEAITFDCYGTFIDWESGILSGLRPVLAAHSVQLNDDEILEHFGKFESEIEAANYQIYKNVLCDVMQRFAEHYNFTLTNQEKNALVDGFTEWKPFSDSVAALHQLKTKFKIGPLTNCDNDLFAISNNYLQTDFDWILTAEKIGSYKPSENNFHYAIDYLAKRDIPKDKILHVAQSIFHDIVPAKKLGLTTIWVNRRHDKAGEGATPPAKALADLTVPDLASLIKEIFN